MAIEVLPSLDLPVLFDDHAEALSICTSSEVPAMTHITRALVTVLSLAFTPLAAQTADSDFCNENPTNSEICERAQQYQREIAPQLPQQMQQNLTFRSVGADKNIITLFVMLHYEREVLEDAVSQGNRTMDGIAIQMKAFAKNSVCSQSLTEEFISLGGVVDYIYQFIDGATYLHFRVDDCQL